MDSFVILALGSNKGTTGLRTPRHVLRAACRALELAGFRDLRCSAIHETAPLLPPQRGFANAVVSGVTDLDPPSLLRQVKAIEQQFGRRTGRVWGPRVLDIDLLSHGTTPWPSRLRWRQARGLAVPHRAMHLRAFVLDPLIEVAPRWCHPVLCLTARQLRARLALTRG